MPVPKPELPQAAQPKHGDHFDAWNSSSTGHQRAENRLGGSIGWRQSRNMKLSHQYKSGETGGERISDTIGAGAKDWDEKAKALIPKHIRERAKYNVRDMLFAPCNKLQYELNGSEDLNGSLHLPENTLTTGKKEQDKNHGEECRIEQSKGVFDGLVIYINGSTYPLVSDHKLKHMLAENGAKLSIHLGRRTVTHVILGRPANSSGLSGAGGGLSGTKLEKEIRKIGGCGIKYVDVEWVLESIKAGKRLPETRFSNLKIAPKSQDSVYGIFKQSSK